MKVNSLIRANWLWSVLKTESLFLPDYSLYSSCITVKVIELKSMFSKKNAPEILWLYLSISMTTLYSYIHGHPPAPITVGQYIVVFPHGGCIVHHNPKHLVFSPLNSFKFDKHRDKQSI